MWACRVPGAALKQMSPCTRRAHSPGREAHTNQGIALMNAILQQKEDSTVRVNNEGRRHLPPGRQAAFRRSCVHCSLRVLGMRPVTVPPAFQNDTNRSIDETEAWEFDACAFGALLHLFQAMWL